MTIKTATISTTLLLLACASIAMSQGPTSLSRPCGDRSTQTSVEVRKDGDILYSPCSGRSSIFNKNVSFRKNNEDLYQYGFSFESLSDYDGLGSRTNVYTEFNLENAAANGTYRNFFTTFNITTATDIAAAVGMSANLSKTGTGYAHDVQGFSGSTTVTDGRVGSGIYGIVGSVGVFGGGTHGDIADLRVGGSTVSNMSARSYSGIWISRPTMTNSTFTGPVTALRVDSALRTPAFTISQTGQIRIVNPITPATSGSPCQAGEIVWDPDFVYVCVSTDSWKRTTLTAW